MMELKSAWEIALEKHEEYEKLSVVTDELLDHVAMLEESWDAIRPPERSDTAPAAGFSDFSQKMAA
jgi:hypothetical protein